MFSSVIRSWRKTLALSANEACDSGSLIRRKRGARESRAHVGPQDWRGPCRHPDDSEPPLLIQRQLGHGAALGASARQAITVTTTRATISSPLINSSRAPTDHPGNRRTLRTLAIPPPK